MGFYQNLLASDVWLQSPEARCVYMALYEMADKHGIVTASLGAIALRANVPQETLDRSLTSLARHALVAADTAGWRVCNIVGVRGATAVIVNRDKSKIRARRKRLRDNGSRQPAKSRVAK